MIPNRQKHQQEVYSFLQKQFSTNDLTFSLPSGSGMETYQVRGNQQDYFVKIGAPLERYLAMAELGMNFEKEAKDEYGPFLVYAMNK